MSTRRDVDEVELLMAQRLSRYHQPSEARHRVHDVVDLASGRVHTTPIQRVPSATTRMQRLMDLGFAADALISAKQRYRLTPQRPHQASPRAWLDAFSTSATTGGPGDFFGVYNAGPGADQIWWRVPPSFPNLYWATCNFSFAEVPAGQAVISLSFEVWPYQGATGHVVIYVGAQRTEIEITASAARTVDIGFTHNGDAVLLAMVLLRQGIFDFVFRSVALRHGPIVVHPSPH